jgi:hypothetical protein
MELDIVRILLALFGLAACGRTPTASDIVVPTAGPRAVIRAISIPAIDTFTTRRRLVIRDADSWQKAILSTVPHGWPLPASVDFTRELVIVVGTRTFSGTGPFIQIDSVRLRKQELTAYVRTGSCAGPSLGGQMMTTPVYAIAAPVKYTKIRFVESYEVEPGCFGKLPDTTA